MALPLEQEVMADIGLGQHYSWFNGSGSCQYTRNKAIELLPEKARDKGLQISDKWLAHCKTASLVDQHNAGVYSLTNVWIACSYAIADAIHREDGGLGYDPPEGDDHWHFHNSEKRQKWLMRQVLKRSNVMNTEIYLETSNPLDLAEWLEDAEEAIERAIKIAEEVEDLKEEETEEK